MWIFDFWSFSSDWHNKRGRLEHLWFYFRACGFFPEILVYKLVHFDHVQAIWEGADAVIAVGGDGTLHEVRPDSLWDCGLMVILLPSMIDFSLPMLVLHITSDYTILPIGHLSFSLSISALSSHNISDQFHLSNGPRLEVNFFYSHISSCSPSDYTILSMCQAMSVNKWMSQWTTENVLVFEVIMTKFSSWENASVKLCVGDVKILC